MKILKPQWITYDGRPIFGVDIHPDGNRLATGGQGKDCGSVTMWNLMPIRDKKAELDRKIPKLLCQMENHLACVNCVRWSKSGKYLASGSDDRTVMVWQLGKGFCGGSFGSRHKNVESWKCSFILRGHTGDVLDVNFDHNDRYLASASVDNTVIIWNALKFPDQIKVIKGHSSLVKGVIWDPVGRYLATQSDDKSLRVWRASDFQLDHKITKPFRECSATTHALRLGWSPDGQFIVSTHALNNSGPTAQIIERCNGFSCNNDFVGHRKAVTVVRFNDNLFHSREADSTDHVTVCAVGSKDRSVSIWKTDLRRPLIVVHDLFSQSIVDLGWLPGKKARDIFECVVCSTDGTVAFLQFSKEELGLPLSLAEKREFMQTKYGCVGNFDVNGYGDVNHQIIESAAILSLQTAVQSQSQKLSLKAPKKVVATRKPPSKPFNSTGKQIETRLPDGRLRITPVFVCPPDDVGGSDGSLELVTPFGSSKHESSLLSTHDKEVSEIVGLPKIDTNNSSAKVSESTDANLPNRISDGEIVASAAQLSVVQRKKKATGNRFTGNKATAGDS